MDGTFFRATLSACLISRRQSKPPRSSKITTHPLAPTQPPLETNQPIKSIPHEVSKAMDPLEEQLVSNAISNCRTLLYRLNSLGTAINNHLDETGTAFVGPDWNFMAPEACCRTFKVIKTQNFHFTSHEHLMILLGHLLILCREARHDRNMLKKGAGVALLAVAARWRDWEAVEERLGFEVRFGDIGKEELETVCTSIWDVLRAKWMGPPEEKARGSIWHSFRGILWNTIGAIYGDDLDVSKGGRGAAGHLKND